MLARSQNVSKLSYEPRMEERVQTSLWLSHVCSAPPARCPSMVLSAPRAAATACVIISQYCRSPPFTVSPIVLLLYITMSWCNGLTRHPWADATSARTTRGSRTHGAVSAAHTDDRCVSGLQSSFTIIHHTRKFNPSKAADAHTCS